MLKWLRRIITLILMGVLGVFTYLNFADLKENLTLIIWDARYEYPIGVWMLFAMGLGIIYTWIIALLWMWGRHSKSNGNPRTGAFIPRKNSEKTQEVASSQDASATDSAQNTSASRTSRPLNTTEIQGPIPPVTAPFQYLSPTDSASDPSIAGAER